MTINPLMTTPIDELIDLLNPLMRPVRERVPPSDFQRWAQQLNALGQVEWSRFPREAERIQNRVSAALMRRAQDEVGIDPWSRAIALTTALAVLRATDLGCTGMEPWLGEVVDQYEALALALNDLYAGEGRHRTAGPLAFAWIARAALTFLDEFRPHLDDKPRRYFEVLSNALLEPSRVPPVEASDDPVLAYLLARVAPPDREPPAIPRRRDGTWVERFCAFFNGNPRRWTRGGMMLLAGSVLLAVALGVGVWLWRSGNDEVNRFTESQITPIEKALRGDR